MNKIEFLKHSNIREREHLIIILFFSQKICKFKVYQNSKPINEIIILQVPKIKCSCYQTAIIKELQPVTYRYQTLCLKIPWFRKSGSDSLKRILLP